MNLYLTFFKCCRWKLLIPLLFRDANTAAVEELIINVGRSNKWASNGVRQPTCCLFNSELTLHSKQWANLKSSFICLARGYNIQRVLSCEAKESVGFGCRNSRCCCCFSAGWIILHPALTERRKHAAEGWREASCSQAVPPAVIAVTLFFLPCWKPSCLLCTQIMNSIRFIACVRAHRCYTLRVPCAFAAPCCHAVKVHWIIQIFVLQVKI